MKIIDSIKRHPRLTGATAAIVAGTAIAEIVGYATYDVPEGACLSPLAVSPVYAEPGTNLYLQTHTGLFTTGVVASGTVSEGAYGLQASFKAPGAGPGEWDRNASDMIKANDAGKFALKMAIGDGEVQFGVRVVAPEGSPLCDTALDITYAHFDRGGYFGVDAQVPWRNPVNVVTNLF